MTESANSSRSSDQTIGLFLPATTPHSPEDCAMCATLIALVDLINEILGDAQNNALSSGAAAQNGA